MHQAIVFIALYTLASMSVTHSTRTCFRNPDCYCNYPIRPDKRFIVYCSNVTNTDRLKLFLHSRFPSQKIDQLRVSGSLESLPSKIFENLTIAQLSIRCPLQSIADDSLQGIQDLEDVELDMTTLSTIPRALVNLPSLLGMQMNDGNLRSVDGELSNVRTIVRLQLARNHIDHLSPSAFRSLRGLQELDVSGNHLSQMGPETFQYLKFLRTVNLSGNGLETADGLFSNLNLVTIDLSRNNLSNIDSAFSSLSNLKSLNLSCNPLIHVNASAFTDLTELRTLALTDCHLSELDPNLLQAMPHLSELRLNRNRIRELPEEFFRDAVELESIDASENQIESLSSLPESTYMQNLDFHANHITEITLRSMPKLLELDLSGNLIEAVLVEDFKTTPSLQHLNLSSNNLLTLEDECFKPLKDLDVLDLSFNVHLVQLNGSLEGSRFKYLYLNSNSLESLQEENFLHMVRLKHIYLRDNRIGFINESFRGLKNVEYVDLSGNNLTTLTRKSFSSLSRLELLLEGNNWTCDCRLLWLIELNAKFNGSRIKDEPLCQFPENLDGVKIRDLKSEDVILWKEDCPKSCICACTAEDQYAFTLVNCSRKGLTKISKTFPVNSREIHLEDNRITSLEDVSLEKLFDLNLLNLEDNRIEELKLVFPPKMEVLKLAGNALKRFPTGDVRNGTFSVLTLSRNPWSCDCEDFKFRNWLLWNNNSVSDLNEVRCADNSGIFLTNKVIVHLDYEDFCNHKLLIILLSTVGTFVVFSLVIIYCCCHKSIAALLYGCGCICLKKRDRRLTVYDGFLIFSEKDRDFAVSELATGLENSGSEFSLCLPGRDIDISWDTDANFRTILTECSKIIVILTRDLLNDGQRMNFLRAILAFSSEDSTHRTVVVKRPDSPSASEEVDDHLAVMVRSSPSVTWGEALFWTKLRYAMPRRCKETDQEVNAGVQTESTRLLEDVTH